MYPSEFSAAEAAYSPVEPPLFVGLPPLLVLLLLVLALGLAALMFWAGRRNAQQSGGSDVGKAAEEIHKAILLASLSAMGASSNDLKSRSEALRASIRDCLGPVLDLARGVSGPVKALDEALKGEVKVEPKPDADHGHKDHGAKATAGCSCGKPHACTCGGAPAAAPAVTINQVYVGGAPATAPGPHKPDGAAHGGDHAAHPKPAEPKPTTRPMTGPEQIDALSKAVRQFHDHWSQKDDRIRELRAAQAALSRRPPASALKTVEERRVWDRL